MKVLICGDRDWNDEVTIWQRMEKLPPDTIIIEGGARGADLTAAAIAGDLHFRVMEFRADWERHGRAAGPLRNLRMLREKPDLVIAFHSDLTKSRGTAHTVREARKRGIRVEVIASPHSAY